MQGLFCRKSRGLAAVLILLFALAGPAAVADEGTRIGPPIGDQSQEEVQTDSPALLDVVWLWFMTLVA